MSTFHYTQDALVLNLLRNKRFVKNYELRQVSLSHRDSIWHLRKKYGIVIERSVVSGKTFQYRIVEDNKQVRIEEGKIKETGQLEITQVSRGKVETISEKDAEAFLERLGKIMDRNEKEVKHTVWDTIRNFFA